VRAGVSWHLFWSQHWKKQWWSAMLRAVMLHRLDIRVLPIL
jgi:hypothetical protein